MKTRNYVSIEYENNYSMPKLTLKPLNRYFFPQKTYSSEYNYNNKRILNLKTSFGNIFSKANNTKYNTLFLSFKDKNSNISNRNTYYKTNNFSPESTMTFVSSMKSIKEKYKRTKINQSKNSPLSLKKIEFINDKENEDNNYINIQQNNLKYIFVGNKDPPKKIQLKKDQRKDIIKPNIEISGQNLIKGKLFDTNKSIDLNAILNKNNINTNIDFISYPNCKPTKNIKNKNNLINITNKKRNESLKLKDINVKPLEDYNEKNTDYNYDNTNVKKTKTLYYKTNSNKKLIVQIKTRKNTEQKDIDIKIIDDQNTNKNNNVQNTKVNKLINNWEKINYELEADFDRFDPISLKTNHNLNKDFLREKEKEKKFLEKLFENDKIKELVNKYEKNNEEEKKTEEENKSLEINEKNKTQVKPRAFVKSRSRIVKDLKHYSLNKIKVLFKEFFNKEYFKPSEYINYIADKICEDIDSFRNNRYKDKNEEIIEDNFSEYMRELNKKNITKKRLSIVELFKKIEQKPNRNNIFHSQTKLDIKNEKNMRNSNSNTIMKNNTIRNAIKKNDNIKISLDEKFFSSKAIQTQKNINETDNENEKINITTNKEIINNKKTSFRNIILNNNEENQINNKKKKSHSNNKKSEKRKKRKKKTKETKKQKGVQKIIPDIENKKDNIENEEDEEYEKEIIEEIKGIEEEKKDEFEYDKIRSTKPKSKTLINRKDTFRFSHFQKNKNFLDKNDEENDEINQESEKKDDLNLLDELYDFKEYQVDNDFLILDEFDKINLEDDLKSKLIENMKQIFNLLKKEKKTKYDYMKLHNCKKRIKHIIKKLAEKDTKKNLVNKSLQDLSFPENLDERKRLYRLYRTIQNKIIEELDKIDEYEYEESNSSSDKENKVYNNIYEILPIEEEEEKEPERKASVIYSPEKSKKELIYDNMYLYTNDEDDEKNTEIKQEVIDVLNTNKAEESFDNTNKSKEIYSPPKSPSFSIKRRRKFKKIRKQSVLKKILNDEIIEEKNNKISLDQKINNFFEQIQKLKEENIDDLNYEKILGQFFSKQGNNFMENSIMRELRLSNFFRYFQNIRKMDIAGKMYFRNKYLFNSPVKFKKSQN